MDWLPPDPAAFGIWLSAGSHRERKEEYEMEDQQRWRGGGDGKTSIWAIVVLLGVVGALFMFILTAQQRKIDLIEARQIEVLGRMATIENEIARHARDDELKFRQYNPQGSRQ